MSHPSSHPPGGGVARCATGTTGFDLELVDIDCGGTPVAGEARQSVGADPWADLAADAMGEDLQSGDGSESPAPGAYCDFNPDVCGQWGHDSPAGSLQPGLERSRQQSAAIAAMEFCDFTGCDFSGSLAPDALEAHLLRRINNAAGPYEMVGGSLADAVYFPPGVRREPGALQKLYIDRVADGRVGRMEHPSSVWDTFPGISRLHIKEAYILLDWADVGVVRALEFFMAHTIDAHFYSRGVGAKAKAWLKDNGCDPSVYVAFGGTDSRGASGQQLAHLEQQGVQQARDSGGGQATGKGADWRFFAGGFSSTGERQVPLDRRAPYCDPFRAMFTVLVASDVYGAKVNLEWCREFSFLSPPPLTELQRQLYDEAGGRWADVSHTSQLFDYSKDPWHREGAGDAAGHDEKVRVTFDELDTNGNRLLVRVTGAGDKLSVATADDLFRKADANGDGVEEGRALNEQLDRLKEVAKDATAAQHEQLKHQESALQLAQQQQHADEEGARTAARNVDRRWARLLGG
eukprot:gene19520-30271_t